MADPSNPMPSSKADSSSAGATETLLRVPRTSVNHSLTNRMSLLLQRPEDKLLLDGPWCLLCSCVGSPTSGVGRVSPRAVSRTLRDTGINRKLATSPDSAALLSSWHIQPAAPWGGVPVEFQPEPPSTPASSASPTPSTPSSTPLPTGFSGTGEGPPVPPAPAPTKPTLIGPETPIINSDVHLIPVSAPPAAPTGVPTLGVSTLGSFLTLGVSTLGVSTRGVSTLGVSIAGDDSPDDGHFGGTDRHTPTRPAPYDSAVAPQATPAYRRGLAAVGTAALGSPAAGDGPRLPPGGGSGSPGSPTRRPR